ncbi:MAG: Kdo hydroxylase family protein [Alphaproteobacteria bacterium]
MSSTRARDISHVIESLDAISWAGPVSTNMRSSAVDALESGKVLYLPRLAFELSRSEERLLTPTIANSHAKNVSYDPKADKLKGATACEADLTAIRAMLRRYYEYSRKLVEALLPRYTGSLEPGRTSFRPVEIKGRPISSRKDDTRLHIDAFPSTPMANRRILRVFTNVNPEGKTRDWRLGEPFETVATRYASKLRNQVPGSAWVMKKVGMTRGKRTAYDHLMLKLHDAMKADVAYQKSAVQNAFRFPPGATWVVFTDMTSHAAMGGQHLFEQTFYLPVSAMEHEGRAPLRVLERLRAQPLV